MIDIGHTIGNYKITAKLGEGGMGVVYLAEHPVIGKKAAIVSATSIDPAGFSELVERAVAMAKVVPEDPYTGLAETAAPQKNWNWLREFLQTEIELKKILKTFEFYTFMLTRFFSISCFTPILFLAVKFVPSKIPT